MAAAVTAATAVESATTATEAGTAARRITARLAAMVIAAEAAGAGAGLTAALIESPRGLIISVKRSVPAAGIVVDIPGAALHVVPAAALHVVPAATLHVVRDTAFTSRTVVIVSVVKGIAAGVVAIIVVDYAATAPADAQVAPTPSVPAPETDTETDSSPIDRRAAEPDSGIRIPTGPGYDGISVNQPGVIRRDVYNVR